MLNTQVVSIIVSPPRHGTLQAFSPGENMSATVSTNPNTSYAVTSFQGLVEHPRIPTRVARDEDMSAKVSTDPNTSHATTAKLNEVNLFSARFSQGHQDVKLRSEFRV